MYCFYFSFHRALYFYLMNALCRIQTRAFMREKVMLHKMKNEKLNVWGFLHIKYNTFWSVSLEH